MVSLLQQQPLFSALAAANRTHSLWSSSKALTRASVASGHREQSTVPRYSTAATRALAPASSAWILAAAACAPAPGWLARAAACAAVGGGQSVGKKPPVTAPSGPVTMLLAICPN